MLQKQLQHKQLMNLNDVLSFTRCYWYVQAKRSIVPIGNDSEDKYIQPDYGLT